MSNSDDPDYVPDSEEDPQNVTNQVVTSRQSGTVNPQEPADEPADDSSDDDIPLIRRRPRQLGGGDGLEGPSSRRIWRVDNDSDADFHAHRQSDSDADHDSDYSDHDSRPDCDSDSDCDSLPPGSGPATTAAAPLRASRRSPGICLVSVPRQAGRQGRSCGARWRRHVSSGNFGSNT